MSDEKPNVYRFTKPVPGIWLNVVKPKDRTRFSAKARYEATFLLPPDHPDLPAIKKIMGAVAKEEWGTVQGIDFPIEDGNTRADRDAKENKKRDYLRNTVTLKAHANTTSGKGDPLYPPTLVVLNASDAFVRYNGDERKLAEPFFYSGVLTVPTLSFVAYATKTKDGEDRYVTAYLNEILSINSGERIQTGVDDEARYGKPESFLQYRGTVSASNPAAGMVTADDEIPY